MMKKNTFIEAEDRSTLKLLQILLQPTSATHQRIFGSAPDRAVLNENLCFIFYNKNSSSQQRSVVHVQLASIQQDIGGGGGVVVHFGNE